MVTLICVYMFITYVCMYVCMYIMDEFMYRKLLHRTVESRNSQYMCICMYVCIICI